MDFIETPIKGLIVLAPRVFKDNRGYFFESYNKNAIKEGGIENVFVQDNESCSCYGTVRGLHFQKPPFAQAKLVRVIQGTVFDVAVDLRKDSPTFGKWYGVELSGENKKQFFIPRGFAHGFSVLSETALFAYKCDNLYNKASEGAIYLYDKDLGIDWRIPADRAVLSEKDKNNPSFAEYCKNKAF
ncbi:MAG: dTDP-4-dehydrorhamnose 3,5-epimerase [Elusimicrobiales bacterium]|nr:dTDP-4-dehydrorhamnose 3,5-epimerase [Elusimicrobiales bacterium]